MYKIVVIINENIYAIWIYTEHISPFRNLISMHVLYTKYIDVNRKWFRQRARSIYILSKEWQRRKNENFLPSNVSVTLLLLMLNEISVFSSFLKAGKYSRRKYLYTLGNEIFVTYIEILYYGSEFNCCFWIWSLNLAIKLLNLKFRS